MKNRLRSYLVISIFFNAVLLSGCGGGGKDSPGVTVSAIITPAYNSLRTASVDVVRNNCTNGTTIQSEFFADHGAIASISAGLINPSNTVKQMTITIDRYTIDYRSLADSPAAPPIQSDTREKTISFVVSGATPSAVEVAVEFVDLLRKNRYLSDVQSGGLNNYTATYSFEGHSENGAPFTFSAQTDFQIGSFNYCPDGFTPL